VLGGSVIVVGAGVAGLRCAQVLNAAGTDVVLIEQSDRVGGRVASDVIDGYTIDRGFQVLNPAYPQVRRALDVKALELKAFSAEVVLAQGGRFDRLGDPRRAPSAALQSLVSGPGTRMGRLRFAALATRLAVSQPQRWAIASHLSARQWLESQGVDQKTIDELIAPFLAGVLLESDLDTDAMSTALFIRAFMRGSPAVPHAGMGAISEQLAQRLARTQIITNCTVTQVRAQSVETSHGPMRADQVVLAVSAGALAHLGFAAPSQRCVTTWWLAGHEGSRHGSRLVVDRAGSGFTNSLELTAAAPRYAPRGHHLFAISANARRCMADHDVRRVCALLHGLDERTLEVVSVSEVLDALPVMAPGTSIRPSIERDGIVLGGDVVATPSLQGAMASGERAAKVVLAS
jgi:glycine/D-amino acid oxidase-like deaminating enzyme